MKNICERDFEAMEDVMAHLQLVHKVDKQEIMSEYWCLNKKHSEFRCPYKFCSEDFKKINELTYHIQISHLDKKEFFTSGITYIISGFFLPSLFFVNLNITMLYLKTLFF